MYEGDFASFCGLFLTDIDHLRMLKFGFVGISRHCFGQLTCPAPQHCRQAKRITMPSEERWVGVSDVAADLGVAKDSIYRWIEERGLPGHRVGRLFRFKLSEIDEWVRQDNALPAPRSVSRQAGRGKPPNKE